MSNITHIDFGKDKREFRRKLSSLIDRLERHEQDVREDPLPYLRAAQEDSANLMRQMIEVREAMHGPCPTYSSFRDDPHPPVTETMVITKADYNRFKAAETMINGWDIP